MTEPLTLPGLARGLLCAVALLAFHATGCASDVVVSDGNLRLPREGFSASVLTMTLRASKRLDFVAASTPVAQRVELHLMRRNGSEVAMHPADHIELEADEPLVMTMGDGQFHLMAYEVRPSLTSGQIVPLHLKFRNPADGRLTRHTVKLRVVSLPRAPSHGHHDDGH